MYIKKFIYLITIVILSSMVYAGEIHISDIEKVVDYKGFKGEWIENNNPEKLEYFIQTYGSGFEDVVALNGDDYRKINKVFVPFSEDYLEYLRSRESLSTGTSVNDFIWPIEKFDRITSTFGRRWSLFHEGIDIPAGRGIPIIAVSNGRVITARFIENLGNTICLEHRDNIFTKYCHASQVIVKDGDIIKKGQVIGYVGSTGNSTGNHLHFEVRYGDFPLNPLDFLPFNPNVKKAQYIKKLD
jgi:murein DD-endopeptidase MepM/ murein hydrolase activator NlpD